MTDPAVTQNARQWLDRQLDELGGLFNAGSRSATFKQWRQATLTVIQRIWPSYPAKSERFRRIPFGAPVGRPTDREAREYFERGCAEASIYLKSLIGEIAEAGVPEERPAAEAAGFDPGTAEDDFPTVQLPPAGAAAGSEGSSAAALEAEAKSLAEAVAGAAADTDNGPRPIAAAAAPQRSSPEPGGRVSQKSGKSSKKNGNRQRLKDMLGFSDTQPHAESPGAPVESPPGSPRARPENARHPLLLPEILPARAPDGIENAAPAEPEAGIAPEEEEAGRATEEFLRTSPVLTSQPRPVRPVAEFESEFAPAAASSATAIAVSALAAEVDRLGVPDGHRARARAALLDLARQLDSRDVSWDSLREAVYFVMEFPPLGRRVLPLLLPYFDNAA